MKILFENWRRYVNEDIDSRPASITHEWITHGHPVGAPQRVGEVLNHFLTEDGKIEFYEVKFDDGIEILSEDEIVEVHIRQHAHGPKKLKKKKLGEDTSTGPGLPSTKEVAPQYIDESWPQEEV